MLDHITKGTEITTADGYIIVTGYNGHIVYADYYTDDDTKTEERYTLSEIAGLMKELDGKNHRVIYDEPHTVINSYGIEFNYDVTVSYMDDELREYLHNEIAPCSDQEFFDKYAELHNEKFGEVWELDKKYPII